MAAPPPLPGLAFDVDAPISRTSAGGFLVDALRRRPVGRRVLSALTALLFIGGMGLFAYPFFTDVYTTQIVQSRLEDEFETIRVETVEEWEAAVANEQGAALTRISIPRIDIETLVVEGTSPAALRAGAGHYPNTPLPGQDGNVAIAGHRTTYGKPFNRMDEIQVGDEIWLSTPIGDFRYVAVDPPTNGECVRDAQAARDGFAACITTPRDWTVIGQTSERALTLTSCHPKGSANQRIILRARMVDSHPEGTYSQLRDEGRLNALGS